MHILLLLFTGTPGPAGPKGPRGYRGKLKSSKTH